MLWIKEETLSPKRLMLLGDIFSNGINLVRTHQLSDFVMLKSALNTNLQLARDIKNMNPVDMVNWSYCRSKAEEFLKEFKELEEQYNEQ